MRKVRLTIDMEVTDEYYRTEMVELQTAISTGEHQKEMVDEAQTLNQGLLKYDAKFEDVL